MQYRLMIILILSFWPSRNDCQEIYTGFGFGPSFPVVNQTIWDIKGVKRGGTSFNLVRTQMGPVVNSEFFVGHGPFELSLHGSFFRMSQREVQNTQEYRIFDSGGWLNSVLVELRCNISEENKSFRPYLNAGLGAFHFRFKNNQDMFPKLHLGGMFGLGSAFAVRKKRKVYLFSEIRFQLVHFREISADISEKITGTLNIIAGCRFWLASQ